MFSETVELRGHIIDSLILPKVLDEILTRGANFKIDEIKIGQNRVDQSYARIEVSSPAEETLNDTLLRLRQHGAEVLEKAAVQLAAAPSDGVFPDDFYVTTNQRTVICLDGEEVEVQPAIMDCGIAVDPAGKTATAVRFHEVRNGTQVVVGQKGIRVVPVQRSTSRTDEFEFMATSLSSEQPKSAAIRQMAREFTRARADGGKTLLVAGPPVVHTGASEHLENLINAGHVDVLFAGNGLAVHDIEHALFGTYLGVDLHRGAAADRGHENQLRAINAIRRAGGIAAAVDSGLLQKGIMHACVQRKVKVVLAGSIRDDGPLPEVITDTVEAQKAMRAALEGVTVALMMGTMLHSMATASLLPATVKTLCVDINPAAVSKLTDPRNFQALGLVTDIELFLRELLTNLSTAANGSAGSK
ncbi:MAG: TIGR00300 family protein [Chthoniobacterales bacterium]|nr:TIGR00300 family protein [Chthoniobacterales bacterium]